ncbi:hypothetical protein [Nocardia huaxiensis]|uniref:Uncharacterized protein n=1 Tax=Nocardia huaxiensis TaxID=2755382 RepID=A0A7D6ZAV7_9NOCA|nr:hypothetical protein [Nocardia huaxiensis]QLY29298.1 hypothetical protein H0264_29065 [Nocardia huaxiensis]UFS97226.1 hypothetical protein LPY97_04675 [Nocardia huaxiensis]
MALQITDRLITSTVTPETAYWTATSSGGHWELTWLPDHPLTRDQAVSGMVLDEILSAPDAVTAEFAMELAEIRAAELGISLKDVVLRLCARMVERDLLGQNKDAESDAVPGQPPSGHGWRALTLLAHARALEPSLGDHA